jgi:hypothetical protein
MGHRANEWQAVDAVLRLLGKSVSKARRHYRMIRAEFSF